MSHNIANKSQAEQEQIALELEASMLIQKQRLGMINRAQINSEVDKFEDTTQRQRFKNALNKFMKMKQPAEAA